MYGEKCRNTKELVVYDFLDILHVNKYHLVDIGLRSQNENENENNMNQFGFGFIEKRKKNNNNKFVTKILIESKDQNENQERNN